MKNIETTMSETELKTRCNKLTPLEAEEYYRFKMHSFSNLKKFSYLSKIIGVTALIMLLWLLFTVLGILPSPLLIATVAAIFYYEIPDELYSLYTKFWSHYLSIVLGKEDIYARTASKRVRKLLLAKIVRDDYEEKTAEQLNKERDQMSDKYSMNLRVREAVYRRLLSTNILFPHDIDKAQFHFDMDIPTDIYYNQYSIRIAEIIVFLSITSFAGAIAVGLSTGTPAVSTTLSIMAGLIVFGVLHKYGKETYEEILGNFFRYSMTFFYRIYKAQQLGYSYGEYISAVENAEDKFRGEVEKEIKYVRANPFAKEAYMSQTTDFTTNLS